MYAYKSKMAAHIWCGDYPAKDQNGDTSMFFRNKLIFWFEVKAILVCIIWIVIADMIMQGCVWFFILRWLCTLHLFEYWLMVDVLANEAFGILIFLVGCVCYTVWI